MPDDHEADYAHEAWHAAVEYSMGRLDQEFHTQWKARFAAGGRILCPVFLCNETPDSLGALAINLQSYDWIPDAVWSEYGTEALLDEIAMVTGQTRAAGSDDLVPVAPLPEDEVIHDARLIGMGFAGPEYQAIPDEGCAEPDIDQERLSYSFYVVLMNGCCYVRRFMGTGEACMMRGYFDPAHLDPEPISEQLKDGSMGQPHLQLYDLLIALRCSRELALTHYGLPSGEGGTAWLMGTAGFDASNVHPSAN